VSASHAIPELSEVVAIVEAEGEQLRAEFYRPEGPRGRGGDAPVDEEIELRLRERLQRLFPCAFAGEETGVADGAIEGWLWLVDPQDGTFEFLRGRRGSAISVALLRGAQVVLAVVHAPLAPDRGRDTIAWSEGAAGILRNGVLVERTLAGRGLTHGELVWASASSSHRPQTWSRAVAPARYVAMPSIAYRLARVAAGDGVATTSVHGVNEYDIAAGLGLIRAAGGVALDAEGREIVLEANPETRVSGCFAGAAEAARRLAAFDWSSLEAEPKRAPRVALAFPRRADAPLERAQGALLGQLIGDSLGSLVEFRSEAEIAARYPHGVRELADGGTWHTIAGQPTDDSEMALALARTLVRLGRYDAAAMLEVYREWLASRPLDMGATTESGLLGRPNPESQSNGSLMRVSPIGIWAAGDPARAAATAREDALLTHPNPVCVQAASGYAAAVAAGVAGASRDAMAASALAHCSGPARESIAAAMRGAAPAEFFIQQGSVLTALQNAFYRLLHAPSLEEGLVASVNAGGDTDTNGAIAGALLGAAYGRDAIPQRWTLALLACRACPEGGAPRPRPFMYWPEDALELAEALLYRPPG
jgi:ADP-ribosylglycohydrolase/fructose-1,6-bisphosphatase/inositol monophosphatase family enzyme